MTLPPNWVCEILSPGHERKDMVHHLLLLQSAAVPYYWILSPEDRALIVYELDGGSRILLRPSGTEPKIKYYFEAVTSIDPEEPFSAASERGQARLDALITGFLAEADARALKS